MKFLEIFNFYGLVFAVLLALPYVIMTRRKHPFDKAACPNRGMLILDRIGRLGSFLLMSVHLGVLEQGFTEPKALMQRFWLIATAALVLAAWLFWIIFSKNEKRWAANLIAVASASAVMLSGILQVNTLLLTFGAVYLIGELYLARHAVPRE